MTNLLQGHIENEIDLNGQASCRKSCEPYNFAKPQSCYKDLFCSKQPACNGKFSIGGVHKLRWQEEVGK